MLSLQIKELIRETPDATTIIFDPGHLPFSYEAGQYITLLVRIDDVPYYRPYSLASSPLVDTYPAITVKRVEKGTVSNYLNDKIEVGQSLELIPPQGHFTLKPLTGEKRNLVFIAGGSGITPLYAMIKTVLAAEPKSKVYLIDMNRHQKDIIYAKNLAELVQKNGDRFQIDHVLTRPSADWQGMSGRMTSSRLKDLLTAKALKGEVHYFLCAPKPLIDMSVSTLSGMGIPMKQMHTESFIAPETASMPESVAATVTLRYDGEEEEIKVEKGDRILESAFNQGIYTIPYSCQNGICDTCKAKCLEGKVHMQTDEGLSPEEKAAGYVLTCVSQPLTKEVVIELDN